MQPNFRPRGLAIGVIAALVFSAGAAQSETGTGTVDILTALTLTQDLGLDFGDVVPDPTTAGTAVLSQGSDTPSCTTVSCFGTAQRAQFTVTGSDETVTVNAPASFDLSDGNVLDDMTVTLDAPANATLSSGTATFRVGGSLAVADAQPAGTYTGNYTITVTYP